MDNGALCGGGVFETKGCGDNDCRRSGVNNGGSDGVGSHNVVLTNVRLNDYYYPEDEAKVGANIPGNYDCKTGNWKSECCFCKPNGIRSSQVGVWIPQTRDTAGTSNILITDVVSSSSQADGINLHGYVRRACVCVRVPACVLPERGLPHTPLQPPVSSSACSCSLLLGGSFPHRVCFDVVGANLFCCGFLEMH